MESTGQTIQATTDLDIASKRWNQARKVVLKLSEFPITFSAPIRTLLYDAKNTGKLGTATQFLATRLLRSGTMKAMFYYGALTFCGDRISQSAYLSSADLIRLYHPRDCAAKIALMYLYRRIRSVAAKSAPNWVSLAQQISLRAEYAGHLGQAIPTIGRATAFFAGCGRQLGIAILAIADSEAYRKYLKHLELTQKVYDLEFEEDLWGCTHVEVISNAMQLVGFGPERSHAYVVAMRNSLAAKFDGQTLALEHVLAEEWVNALIYTRKEPDKTHLGEYYPTTQEMHRLLYEVNRLHESGSKFTWLEKTKDDINPMSTPQLFQELLMELEQSGAIASFYQENLPEEIVKDLSPEELAKISKPRFEDKD